MSRSSSQSGTNGHNSFTSAGESSPAAVSGGGGEIMLFGVRVKVDPMRKSVSLNNLSQYELPNGSDNINNNSNSGNNNESSKVADEGYASADDAVPHHSVSGRERKRGVPWTEEEHKLFLLGLQKVGKGDWRGISRNFVKTRTPTQVASHAQKYFLRRTNLNRRRRRSSLFDITTDSVSLVPIEEKQNLQEHQVLAPTSLPPVENSKINAFQVTPLPVTFGQGDQINKNSSIFRRPVPALPLSNSSRIADFNLNQSSAMEASSLSLTLSLSLNQSQSSSTRHSAFQVMSNFNNGESIISVA
ncbi:PREDICTED: transcription factor MYB1R1-like [Nicotiana attenuata]|uniref:transcription factor MYB1R1-like n=1 Tax=Nicotiana attenuata TaxID=49451 RepID=UPI0009058243|nr:PREDICTED: transcription factor MYB1R1-like [Nicotiana attenuata]